MLATYFKQYPAHLAAAARIQATEEASTVDHVKTCRGGMNHDHDHDHDADDPLPANSLGSIKCSSVGARTYTLSENSDGTRDNNCEISQSCRRDHRKSLSKSPKSSPKKDKRPSSEFIEKRNSMSKSTDECRKSIDDTNDRLRILRRVSYENADGRNSASSEEFEGDLKLLNLTSPLEGSCPKSNSVESSDEECLSTVTFNMPSPPLVSSSPGKPYRKNTLCHPNPREFLESPKKTSKNALSRLHNGKSASSSPNSIPYSRSISCNTYSPNKSTMELNLRSSYSSTKSPEDGISPDCPVHGHSAPTTPDIAFLSHTNRIPAQHFEISVVSSHYLRDSLDRKQFYEDKPQFSSLQPDICSSHQPKITSPTSLLDIHSSEGHNQLLKCGICSKRFQKPKVLPCLHTFCEGCLLSYSPAESLTLTCPVCRQQSILPKDGVTGLQVNRWLSGMMENMDHSQTNASNATCSQCKSHATKECEQCSLPLCSSCAHTHAQDSGSDCHSVVSIEGQRAGSSVTSHTASSEDSTLFCTSHKGQTLRFYCRDCETAVCSSCTDIEHRSHSTMRVSEVADEQKEALRDLIDTVTSQLPSAKEALCDLSDLSASLDQRRSEAESSVRQCFRALYDLLQQRQTDLINDINTVASRKKNILEDQHSSLSSWVLSASSGCSLLESSLDADPMEVLLLRKQMGEVVAIETKEEHPYPRENSHLQFILGNIAPLKTALSHVGRIESNSAVPQTTTILGLDKCTIGGRSVCTIVTRDYLGQRVKKGGAEVRATLTTPCLRMRSSPTRSGKDCFRENSPNLIGSSATSTPRSRRSPSPIETIQVLDLNNGCYEMVFCLHQEGLYSLSVIMYGTHINGSPFSFEGIHEEFHSEEENTPPAGKSRNIKRQMSSKSNKASLASRGGSRRPPSHKSSCSVRTNPIEDDLVFKIGRRGRNKGEFGNPQGICFSPVKDGRLVVADSNNQCVQVFNLEGDCKIKFGTRGRTAGQLQRPTGVASTLEGHYAVADYENKWVSLFEPQGKYVGRIGHGKLLGPKGVCVDKKGNFIVVDNKASCVCIFSQSGKMLSKFGGSGMNEHSFAGPHFCAVNSKDEIIVTDFHNHCVKVFNYSGDFLFTFGTSGEGNGQFNAPTGLAVDEHDNMIVADWGNSRLQVFDCHGSFLSYINTLADPLYGPQGLTLTPDGLIVVADSGNHCFKVYKYLQ